MLVEKESCASGFLVSDVGRMDDSRDLPMQKDAQELLKLVLLYPLQVNGIVVALPFFFVEVSYG